MNIEIQKKKKFIKIFHNSVVAWMILFTSLALTVTAYFISDAIVKERAEDRFEFRVSEIEKVIKDRFNVYEQVLWGGVALFYASENVDRDEFAKFVETLNIGEHWPGIQGIGFSVFVAPEDKVAHIEGVRSEGFPGFTIKPHGNRDVYSSIIYLEPFDWRNKRAFGYDMWSNDMRREAMKRALENGEAATSGAITLVQETKTDVQRGFLTYVPVYRTKKIPKTIDERIDNFLGWVYAPFRVKDFMNGVLSAEDLSIEFEIFDGKEISESSLLFDTNESFHLNETAHDPSFSKEVPVIHQGRLWTIYFNTPAGYSLGGTENLPRFVALAGAIIDLLLFYVIFSLHFINKRTEILVNERTSELETAKSGLEDLIRQRTQELEDAKLNLEQKVNKRTQELENKVSELELLNEATMGRENRVVELKAEINRLSAELGRTLPYSGV